MKKVRYAIIGFGGIAENRLAKEGFACDKKRFKALPNAELVGVTDPNKARKSAAEALKLKWYDNAGQIFKDKSIDAVVVASNNLSHVEIATAALNAGKHCLIEKPIATKVKDAEALCKLAKKKKLSLAVDHMMVHNVYNVKARDMIAAGDLGKVNDACLHMEFLYGSSPEEAKSWRCSKVEELGGPIGDVASHCFYVAEFLFGSKIESLCCSYHPKTLKIKAEDGAHIKFQMKNGMTGSVNVSFGSPRGGAALPTFSNLGFEVYGNKGVLRSYATMFQFSGHSDEPISPRLDLDTFKKVQSVKPGKVKNIYQSVIEEHAESILKKKPMDGVDAARNLKLIEAAHKSAKTGGKMVRV